MPASFKNGNSAPLILCVGQDPTLLDTRAAVLRRIGADVQCATGYDEALKAMEMADFDLLILCYSVQEIEKRGISSAALRQHDSPLILLLNSLSAPDSGREGVPFDAISDTHPALLTAYVKDLLHQRTSGLMTSDIAG